jgi:hypothetical protein
MRLASSAGGELECDSGLKAKFTALNVGPPRWIGSSRFLSISLIAVPSCWASGIGTQEIII